MNRSPLVAFAVAAAFTLAPAAPSRAQEKAPTGSATTNASTKGEETTLRIRPTPGEVLRFRRTLTLASGFTVGEGKRLVPDYEVVQDLDVTLKETESGRHRFTVRCAKVKVKASVTVDEGLVSGVWSSEQPEPDFDKDGDFACIAFAAMMGDVLAGKTLGLVTDERATFIQVEDTPERRAAEVEAGPSSSFQPALLEGVAWEPVFLDGDLPEEPVRAGTTFGREESWSTKLPRVVVRAKARMKVLEVNAKRVVMECSAVPRLYRRGAPGKPGEALPEPAFTDASVTGKVILSAKDGLPLDTTWIVAGTYHLEDPSGLERTMHQQAKLTVRVQRVAPKSR